MHEEHAQLRVTDVDRHNVAEVLRDAAGQGRLDLEELDERLEAAYAAKTYADLTPLVADLPNDDRLPVYLAPVSRRPQALAGAAHQKSSAVMGSCKRQGEWTVPPTHNALAIMGDVVLDLRQATLSARETTITATAIMGDVKVIVDEFTQVVVEGTPILGEFKQRPDKVAAQLDRDSPVVRVRGTALMGDVSVQRRPPPGIRRRFLGRF